MKKSYNFLILAAILAASFSCSKENISDNPSQKTEGEGTTLSLTVGTETKTLLRPSSDDPGEVRWGEADQIIIFNEDKKGGIFTTTKELGGNKKVAVFSCGSWVGGTPIVAVHSNKASKSTCTDTSSPKVKTYLNPTQVIKHKQSYALAASASIGLVSEEADKYSIETMKNLFSLIKFKVNDATIVKITMTGNNDEVLAGWMNVDYNGGNPTWTSVKDENDSLARSLVLTATGSACDNDGKFSNATTYYISVLPQTLTNGFTLEIEREDGSKATRIVDKEVKLDRNTIRSINTAIDDGLTFYSYLTLDCTNASNFRYDNNGTTSQLPSRDTRISGNFWLDGYNAYLFNSTAVCRWVGDKSTNPYFLSSTAPVKLPTISGYVLDKMEVTGIKHSADRTYAITTDINGTCVLGEAADLGTKSGNTTHTFDLSDVSTTETDRYIYCSTGSKVSEMGVKFILTYKSVTE